MEKKNILIDYNGSRHPISRMQVKGLTCDESAGSMPEREDFTLKVYAVPGMKNKVSIIIQQESPKMQFQVIEASSTLQFERYMAKLLQMHDRPSYIEGFHDFMVLFQGARERVDVTQDNHKEICEEISRLQDQAARWWFLYGRETLALINYKNTKK